MYSRKAFLFCYRNRKRYLSCRVFYILKFSVSLLVSSANKKYVLKTVQHIRTITRRLFIEQKLYRYMYIVQFCLHYNSTRKHEQLEKMEPNQRGYLYTLISLHTGAFIIEGYKYYVLHNAAN
jgi:hypothetical protein